MSVAQPPKKIFLMFSIAVFLQNSWKLSLFIPLIKPSPKPSTSLAPASPIFCKFSLVVNAFTNAMTTSVANGIKSGKFSLIAFNTPVKNSTNLGTTIGILFFNNSSPFLRPSNKKSVKLYPTSPKDFSPESSPDKFSPKSFPISVRPFSKPSPTLPMIP